MAMPLSKLIDNLSEWIHNNKCADCKSCLDYIKTKNEKLILTRFNCEKYYKKKINKVRMNSVIKILINLSYC